MALSSWEELRLSLSPGRLKSSGFLPFASALQFCYWDRDNATESETNYETVDLVELVDLTILYFADVAAERVGGGGELAVLRTGSVHGHVDGVVIRRRRQAPVVVLTREGVVHRAPVNMAPFYGARSTNEYVVCNVPSDVAPFVDVVPRGSRCLPTSHGQITVLKSTIEFCLVEEGG